MIDITPGGRPLEGALYWQVPSTDLTDMRDVEVAEQDAAGRSLDPIEAVRQYANRFPHAQPPAAKPVQHPPSILATSKYSAPPPPKALAPLPPQNIRYLPERPPEPLVKAAPSITVDYGPPAQHKTPLTPFGGYPMHTPQQLSLIHISERTRPY